MISRNIPLVDKNALLDPSIKSPINLGQNIKTLILPDCTKSSLEIVARFIQNTGTQSIYIGIGFQCDSSNYSFILADDLSSLVVTKVLPILSTQAVYAFCSAGAGIIAAYQLYRNDLSQTGNPIRSGQLQAPG